MKVILYIVITSFHPQYGHNVSTQTLEFDSMETCGYMGKTMYASFRQYAPPIHKFNWDCIEVPTRNQ